MSRHKIIPFAMLMIVAVPTSLTFGCEMCRDAVATSANTSTAGVSFNGSILYMLAALFAVMGFIGRIMFKAIQREHD